MGRGLQGAVLKGLGAKDHVLTVKAKAAIGPHLVRITFAAPSLFSDRTYIPSAWFRGWFPDPKGSSTQFQRGYTIAAIDTPLQQIAVDFVLHEPSGPASTWARTCAPGDQLPITFYGGEDGFRTLDPPPAGYLLLGCMASYPAIQAITAIIQDTHPDLPVHILMEAHDPLDYAMPLPTGSTITADWVDPLPDGQAFVHAIGGQDYTGWYAWIAGEGRSTRHAKTYLQRECGATRATIQATAILVRSLAWRAMGKSMVLPAVTYRCTSAR